jgi:hypothetical protein
MISVIDLNIRFWRFKISPPGKPFKNIGISFAIDGL